MAKDKYNQFNKFSSNKQPVEQVTDEPPLYELIQDPDTVEEESVSQESIQEVIPQPQPESKPQMAQEQAPQVTEPSYTKEIPVQPQIKKTPEPVKFLAVHRVEMELNNYLEVMGLGKPITPELGGTWQYSLYQTLKGIFAAKDQVTFNAEWGTLLHFFGQNQDNVFNDKFMFRFPEYWSGSANEFTLFRRLIYVAMETTNIKTRKNDIKNLNLDKATEGLPEEQKNKLINFYSA